MIFIQTLEGLSADKEPEGIKTDIETICMWKTPLCNMFLPSGTAWTQSHVYCFHLKMDCSCTDNTKRMMGSSGYMVTWLLIVKHCFHSALIGQVLSLQKEQLPSDNGRALHQTPNSFFCDAPIGTCQILQAASLSATDTSSTMCSAGYGPVEYAQ